ncbi:helix-turn-helix transcriptional regulator [Burkholderiaceae bacterium]|nr:helix-turn-helix transcriptional regulator [Burkholderiaceae bacterium]
MTRISFADMDCPIAQAAEQLADKWKFVIIRNAFNGMRRFDDFAEQLGVASNVLTARLSELVAADILTRVPVDGDGRAVEYRLTAKGHDLFPMVIFLAQWSDRWLKKRGGAAFRNHLRRHGRVGAANAGDNRFRGGGHLQARADKRGPWAK